MAFDDDSRLARKAQRGDRQAFEVILSRYERPIFSFIHHFFRNPELCEDLTQETFLRAFRFIKSFRTKEKLSTWLFSIAKNLCIDELRRMRKGTTVDIDAVDPDDLVLGSDPASDPVNASFRRRKSSTGPSPACPRSTVPASSCSISTSSPTRRSRT